MAGKSKKSENGNPTRNTWNKKENKCAADPEGLENDQWIMKLSI